MNELSGASVQMALMSQEAAPLRHALLLFGSVFQPAENLSPTAHRVESVVVRRAIQR